ncbi:MAG: DNA polymerase III subunit delta [Acidimicrobiia bacterium]
MTSLLAVSGPSNAGPGERQEMLERAKRFLAEVEVDSGDIVRLDVPSRGSGEETEGRLRGEVEPLVPMLQSGSLFGGRQGLLVVDAQNLNVAESSLVAELLDQFDEDAVAVVLVTFGSLPAPITKVVKTKGEAVAVRKMWERQATEWLRSELNSHALDLDAEAQDALLQRFGTDTAGLSQAIDQLVEHKGKITRQLILDRFRNRPDDPLVHFIDAVVAGKTGDALRRLSDFLTHGHPLVLLAAIESDLRRRSLSSTAEDEQTFRAAVGARADDRRVTRIWNQRGRIKDSSLQKALEGLVRADRVLKTQPEEVHRVTLERLTVALCRWYGGRS